MAKKTTNPDPKVEAKKKARIIANSQYPEFREEFERTKAQYLKHYPGGVEFIEARGYDELEKAFGTVAPQEDLIMMAHYNPDAMYGVPVSDPTFKTFDAPEGKTLATLFSGLEKKGYQGNCYLGICHGENIAMDIQEAGVNIPMFTTWGGDKWYGANPKAKGDFESFFFGIKGEDDKTEEGKYITTPINATIDQDYRLRISKKHKELMDRRKSGQPVKEVIPLKMDLGGIVEKLGGAQGIAGTTGSLIQGLQMLGNEKNNRQQTEQMMALSQIVSQAAGIRPEPQQRKYVRPEDMVIDPNQLHSSYGTGSNLLAKNGAKLPSYNPGGWITDITGEGNEGNVGSLVGNLIGGGTGQQTGAGKIGSTIGGVAGSFLGPIGGAAGSAIGGLLGGAIGGNQQKRVERQQKDALNMLQGAAFQQGMSSLQGNYSAFMKNGGNVQMEGELQVYKGEAEPISQNPYLPDGGQTVMFNGPSHEDGGMPIKFGGQKVEVEGGEPAVKLPGDKGDNLVVFGDMKIPSYGVSELNDPAAKGKKFKTYVKGLSELEAKQNKIVDKGIKLVNETDPVDSFDKLKLSSGKAMVEGGNMKLREIADKKKMAASIQNAILQTAEELNLKSDDLAKGKVKKAKKGTYLKAEDGWPPKAAVNNPEFHEFKDRGTNIPLTIPVDLAGRIRSANGGGAPFAHQSGAPEVREDGFAGSTEPEKGKGFDWMSVVNSVLPFARPSNKMTLDPNQLSGEMFALASNQLEPVQAQTYSPLLESVSDISLQDQLNANQSDFNALKRLTAGNPAAQATLAGQKYAANSSVLGEQFRLNQAQKTGTFNRNRATLNDATLKNLSILDQQYARQAQAKSNTKSVAQAALSSIADKIAKNKLENKTLSIYENLYNYRFGPNGQAINVNPLAQFTIPEVGSVAQAGKDEEKMTYREWETIKKDSLGMPTGKTEGRMTTKKNKNGGIVKAIKNL